MFRLHLPQAERHGGLQPLWSVFSDLARDNRTHTSGTRRGETPLPITSTVSTRASPFGRCNAFAQTARKPGPAKIDYFLRPLPPRPLNVSSAMPDLSSSPKPSFTIFAYCLNVASASGRSSFFSRARLKAIPESFAACAAEKKQECSRFCI